MDTDVTYVIHKGYCGYWSYMWYIKEIVDSEATYVLCTWEIVDSEATYVICKDIMDSETTYVLCKGNCG